MAQFEPGTLVRVISTDGFWPGEMPVGSIWRVVADGLGASYFTVEYVSGGGPKRTHVLYSPHSHKFEAYPPPITKMDDAEYEDVFAGQEAYRALVDAGR